MTERPSQRKSRQGTAQGPTPPVVAAMAAELANFAEDAAMPPLSCLLRIAAEEAIGGTRTNLLKNRDSLEIQTQDARSDLQRI
jgi:hypothetical protein